MIHTIRVFHVSRKLTPLVLAIAFAVFVNIPASAEELNSTVAPVQKTSVVIDSVSVEPSFGTAAGSWFYHAGPQSSQVLLLGFPKSGIEQKPDYRLYVDLKSESQVKLLLPAVSGKLACRARSLGKYAPTIQWNQSQNASETTTLTERYQTLEADQEISLTVSAPKFDEVSAEQDGTPLCAVELVDFQLETNGQTSPLSLDPMRKNQSLKPIETSPDFRPAIEKALIVWD